MGLVTNLAILIAVTQMLLHMSHVDLNVQAYQGHSLFQMSSLT